MADGASGQAGRGRAARRRAASRRARRTSPPPPGRRPRAPRRRGERPGPRRRLRGGSPRATRRGRRGRPPVRRQPAAAGGPPGDGGDPRRRHGRLRAGLDRPGGAAAPRARATDRGGRGRLLREPSRHPHGGHRRPARRCLPGRGTPGRPDPEADAWLRVLHAWDFLSRHARVDADAGGAFQGRRPEPPGGWSGRPRLVSRHVSREGQIRRGACNAKANFFGIFLAAAGLGPLAADRGERPSGRQRWPGEPRLQRRPHPRDLAPPRPRLRPRLATPASCPPSTGHGAAGPHPDERRRPADGRNPHPFGCHQPRHVRMVTVPPFQAPAVPPPRRGPVRGARLAAPSRLRQPTMGRVAASRKARTAPSTSPERAP